ncbi:hypothetical protein SAMN02745673_03469 [Marinactinospora thermotolerans DSM 45154]|uniref:Uncharacterized protein n=1 Tax=Marinactinospora thermotolerans DSM 45154 TaxID=1122192 RepID=A0A1T4SEM1_9ACTN|nr:hypothetical protein SAMN02745673_03469 [Marinactinospora thermotolerans DSM 45154]
MTMPRLHASGAAPGHPPGRRTPVRRSRRGDVFRRRARPVRGRTRERPSFRFRVPRRIAVYETEPTSPESHDEAARALQTALDRRDNGGPLRA